jgi:spore coat protein U-like protein
MKVAALYAIAGAAACFAAPASACTISTTSVAFGTYNPGSATALDGTGAVNLICPTSVRTGPVVSISTGNSGSYAPRRMNSGTNTLDYNLYTSATRVTVWGNGTAGTARVTAPRLTSSTPIYGRIPAGQNVRAGTYTDTLTVTVTF